MYYRLSRALDGTGVFNRTVTVGASQTAYTDSTIPAGTKSATYYIIALDRAQNESAQSNKVTVNLLTSEPSPNPPKKPR
ncbi:MAG: hypothetical protein H6727_21100 [Myxococcales bacterium]|nr:hypothetical protein [Myxococcales bacterium]